MDLQDLHTRKGSSLRYRHPLQGQKARSAMSVRRLVSRKTSSRHCHRACGHGQRKSLTATYASSISIPKTVGSSLTLKLAQQLMGRPRHLGQHPAGLC